jgi:hypothetical protein
MQFPCNGELEEESWQANNEIAGVNGDLDSVDDDGIALKEEKEGPGEEEQSIRRPGTPSAVRVPRNDVPYP